MRALVILALLPILPTAAAVPTDIVPPASAGWTYLVTTHGGAPGFQAVAYDDSAWGTGAAPFRSAAGCPGQGRATDWPANRDLVVRRDIFLPAGTTNVIVGAGIDNDITAYWNGVQIGAQAFGGCSPAMDRVVYNVPDALLTENNVLAIRGHDYGGVAFFDARVAAELPELPPPVPEMGSVLLVAVGLVGVAAILGTRKV